jgi:hypothetical protein
VIKRVRNAVRTAFVLFALVVIASLVMSASPAQAAPAQAGTRASSMTTSDVANHTGTASLSLVNSRSNWLDSNDTLVLDISTNRHINGLNVSISSFTALDDMWWGGWSDPAGGSDYDVSNDTNLGRAQQIYLPGRFKIDLTQFYSKRDDQGGSGFQELLVQVTDDASNLPGNVLANISSNLTALDASLAWNEFTLSEPINTTGIIWCVLNGSALFTDRLSWRMRGDNPTPNGMEAAISGGSWVSAAAWDGLAMIRGSRLNSAGTALWTGSAASCNVSADGGAFRSLSGSRILNTSDVRDGNVVLTLQSNVSASTSISWTWLFRPINDTVEETVEEVESVPLPWVDTFLDVHGWHLVFLILVLAVIVVVTLLLWAYVGPWVLVAGLVLLLGYFAFLFFFPATSKPAARFWAANNQLGLDHTNESLQITWSALVNGTTRSGDFWDESINASNDYWAAQGTLYLTSSETWWCSWGCYADCTFGCPCGGACWVLLAVIITLAIGLAIWYGVDIQRAILFLLIAYLVLTLLAAIYSSPSVLFSLL